MSAASAQIETAAAEPARLGWTDEEWEACRQRCIAERRAQGLPDTIEDPIALHRAGVILAAV